MSAEPWRSTFVEYGSGGTLIHTLTRMVEEGPLATPTRAFASILSLWVCEALLVRCGVGIGRLNGATESVAELSYLAIIGPMMIGALAIGPLEAAFEALNLPTQGSGTFETIAIASLVAAAIGYWIGLLWLSWKALRHRSVGAFLAAGAFVATTSPLLAFGPALATI